MENTKNTIKFIFILILFVGCKTNRNLYILNQEINKLKVSFGIETNKKYFLDFFPEKITSINNFMESYPPSSPPTYKYCKQYGDVILIVNINDYQKELLNLLSKEIYYKTEYTNENIIVNLSEFKNNVFPVKKCNTWYNKKLPIPYFEKYNFGLGELKKKKYLKGEEIPYYNYTYKIPNDLQVYVLGAEAGNFWKESCNEVRPESLKNWKHGYSKGFAMSEIEEMLIFWTMIW